MNTQFEINKLTFDMQGDGFANHEADFNQVVENTINALYALSAADLARLHAGSIWISNEDFDGFTDEAVADELTRVATKAAEPVLADWKNTDNIIISLNGLP
jgi:hypothetical protein